MSLTLQLFHMKLRVEFWRVQLTMCYFFIIFNRGVLLIFQNVSLCVSVKLMECLEHMSPPSLLQAAPGFLVHFISQELAPPVFISLNTAHCIMTGIEGFR